MEEVITTRVKPAVVWAVWDKGHSLETGSKGKQVFRYKILDVKPGEQFSILWKSLFVRLVFTYSVFPFHGGSQIHYKVKVKGLFAFFVKKLIAKRIQRSLKGALLQMVQKLEDQSIK